MDGMEKYEKREFVRFHDLRWIDINCDLHLHTDKTDGRAGVRKIIQYAKERGLKKIAFTEHVRRGTEWFDEFIDEIQEERVIFPMLEILVGCETKALDKQGSVDVTEEIMRKCDIVLGSVHRFPNGTGDYMDFSRLSKKVMAQTELELSLGLLKNSCIDVLAHPGGMCFRQFCSDFPQDMMREILKSSLGKNIAIEINSSYLGDFGAFVALCDEINPYVSIGSDVHYLDQMGECRDRLIAHGIGCLK